LSQTPETALIDPIIQLHSFRKQLHCLRPQVQPFDIDFPIRTSRRYDQETKTVDMLLETAIRQVFR
jgi:hypothetical protein